MVNQRLTFLVCLTSIILFSLIDCSGGTTNQSKTDPEIPSKNGPNTSNVTKASDNVSATIKNNTDKNSNASIPTPETPTNDTTTEDPHPKPKPTTTTTTSTPAPVPTSTVIPSSSTPVPPSPVTTTISPPSTTPTPKHDRAFDLPSFIGGVIVSLGIAAISYVVYKFYKTRTDPNYRSL